MTTLNFLQRHGFMICYFMLFVGALTSTAMAGVDYHNRKAWLLGALLLISAWVILTFAIGFIPRLSLPFY